MTRPPYGRLDRLRLAPIRLAATFAIGVLFLAPRLARGRFFLRLVTSWFGWLAPSYDRLVARLVDLDRYLAPLERLLAGLPSPSRRILDLASGTALGARAALARIPEATIVAADVSVAMLQEARRKQRHETRTIHFVAASSDELPFRAACFDLTLTMNAPAYLLEMNRVTKFGGTVGVAYSMPFSRAIRGLVARRLRKAGLEAVTVVPAGLGLAGWGRRGAG